MFARIKMPVTSETTDALKKKEILHSLIKTP
jgi:hypothetical protein